jgi:hypothetical protein
MNAFEFIIFPAAGSPTATLLRLHHNHGFYSDVKILNFTFLVSIKLFNTFKIKSTSRV